jgi:hypothetical protein
MALGARNASGRAVRSASRSDPIGPTSDAANAAPMSAKSTPCGEDAEEAEHGSGVTLAAHHVPLSPPTRVSYFSPEVALALDPARAAALLRALDAPRLAALARRRDPLVLARALWARPLPWVVADALDDLARLATPLGRDALLEAARDTRTPCDGWEERSPADVAARLLEDRIGNHRCLVRAHMRLGRMLPDRPTYELRGAAPRKVPSTAALAGALERVAGAGSEAWVSEDDEGTIHAVVIYPAPAERAWSPGRGGALVRPARADAFRFLVSDARLQVTTARPQRLDAYAAAWGSALYGEPREPRFFLAAPSLTLKPLQGLGSKGLAGAALPPDVTRARVIACQLDTGEAERLEARGPGALAKLAPHLRAGGYLTRATIRFDVFGEIRPIDAVVELPHRLEIGPGGAAAAGTRAARVVRAALGRLGLLSPGAIADDVTTLLPLVHAEWRWRAIVGDDGLAAMRQASLFDVVAAEKTRRAAVEAMRRAGRSAVAFALYRPMQTRGEIDPTASKAERRLAKALLDADRAMTDATDYYVIPEDWAIPAVTLRKHEMVMLRLALARVVAKARRELGLERAGERKPKVPKGVWWVGDLRVASGVARFFYVVRPAIDEREKAALAKAIARAAGFKRAVALVPRGRKLGQGLVEVELGVKEQLGAASWRGKLAEAVGELGVADEVEPWRMVSEDVDVVVDARRAKVWIRGVEQTRMGESGVRMILALARRGDGKVVPTGEVEKEMSKRPSPGAAKAAARKIPGWVEESFAAARTPVPEEIRAQGVVRWIANRGWTLQGKGVVVEGGEQVVG